jgi:hypothetical protein
MLLRRDAVGPDSCLLKLTAYVAASYHTSQYFKLLPSGKFGVHSSCHHPSTGLHLQSVPSYNITQSTASLQLVSPRVGFSTNLPTAFLPRYLAQGVVNPGATSLLMFRLRRFHSHREHPVCDRSALRKYRLARLQGMPVV